MLLPRHSRWNGFFSRLAYVIVDECHGYRGVFGSHVGHVLRRVRRIAIHHGQGRRLGPARMARCSCSHRPPSASPARAHACSPGRRRRRSPRAPPRAASSRSGCGNRRSPPPAARPARRPPQRHHGGRAAAGRPGRSRCPDARLHPLAARRRGGRPGRAPVAGRRRRRERRAVGRAAGGRLPLRLPARRPQAAGGGAAGRADHSGSPRRPHSSSGSTSPAWMPC